MDRALHTSASLLRTCSSTWRHLRFKSKLKKCLFREATDRACAPRFAQSPEGQCLSGVVYLLVLGIKGVRAGVVPSESLGFIGFSVRAYWIGCVLSTVFSIALNVSQNKKKMCTTILPTLKTNKQTNQEQSEKVPFTQLSFPQRTLLVRSSTHSSISTNTHTQTAFKGD